MNMQLCDRLLFIAFYTHHVIVLTFYNNFPLFFFFFGKTGSFIDSFNGFYIVSRCNSSSEPEGTDRKPQ